MKCVFCKLKYVITSVKFCKEELGLKNKFGLGFYSINITMMKMISKHNLSSVPRLFLILFFQMFSCFPATISFVCASVVGDPDLHLPTVQENHELLRVLST